MKLKATGPIKHDGQRYEEGDTFEVKNKKQAQALIDSGSATGPGSRDDDDKGPSDAADPSKDPSDPKTPKTEKVIDTTPPATGGKASSK